MSQRDLINQCLNILKREDVKRELKILISPLINMSRNISIYLFITYICYY